MGRGGGRLRWDGMGRGREGGRWQTLQTCLRELHVVTACVILCKNKSEQIKKNNINGRMVECSALHADCKFFSGGGHTLCCEHVPKHTKPEGRSHMRLKQWRTSNSNHQLGLQGSLIFAAPLLHKYRESARHAMA